MVGPSASVLLREMWTELDVAKFYRWLHTGLVQDEYDGGWYRVRRAAWHQLPPPDRLCPFLVDVGRWNEYNDPAEEASMRTAVGYLPGTAIVLAAACSGPDNHRALGELALMVARRYDGLIDLGGRLQAQLPPDIAGLLPDHPHREAWMAAWQAEVDRMPGVRHEITYTNEPGESYLSYLVVDVEFLEHWLIHPQFRMVK